MGAAPGAAPAEAARDPKATHQTDKLIGERLREERSRVERPRGERLKWETDKLIGERLREERSRVERPRCERLKGETGRGQDRDPEGRGRKRRCLERKG